MAKCNYIKGQHRKVCIGDLDRKIEIYSRAIKPPADDQDMQHGQEYTLKYKPYAMIKTLRGITTFDGIEITGVEALEIFIRYDSRVTTQDFVRLDGKNISIKSIEDLDRRKEFMRLICVEEGDKDRAASL